MQADPPPAGNARPVDQDSRKLAYRGRIRKGDAPDTIEGEIACVITGWAIQLVGKRDGNGYAVEGFLCPVPDAWRIPELDGEKPR